MLFWQLYINKAPDKQNEPLFVKRFMEKRILSDRSEKPLIALHNSLWQFVRYSLTNQPSRPGNLIRLRRYALSAAPAARPAGKCTHEYRASIYVLFWWLYPSILTKWCQRLSVEGKWTLSAIPKSGTGFLILSVEMMKNRKKKEFVFSDNYICLTSEDKYFSR